MAINPLIQSAQSNAPVTTQSPRPTGITPGFMSNIRAPQDVLGSNPIDKMQVSALKYPSDVPKYYMQFDIFNYSRQSISSVGSLSPDTSLGGSTIILPLAQDLHDMHQLYWTDNIDIGQLTGAAINAITNSEQRQQVLNQLKSMKLSDITADQVGQVAAGLGVGGAEALFGISPNQFMTVLFVGPVYKRHEFVWALSPHNQREADTIQKIIQVFNNAMSPQMAGPLGVIWLWPDIFKISFQPNFNYLYKFKPAVLESFNVNYTPAGKAAFYQSDGSSVLGVGGGTNNAPEGVIMNMRFIEIEFWLKGDFQNTATPDPNSATQGQATTSTPPVTTTP